MREIDDNLYEVKNWKELQELILSLKEKENINLVSFTSEHGKKICESLVFGKVDLDDFESYCVIQSEFTHKLNDPFN